MNRKKRFQFVVKQVSHSNNLILFLHVLIIHQSKATHYEPDGRSPEGKITNKTTEHIWREYFINGRVGQRQIKVGTFKLLQ